jgi:hypothetical protein
MNDSTNKLKHKDSDSASTPRPRLLSLMTWQVFATGAVGLIAVAGCGLQNIPTDARIDNLCKKDGGVTVYERVMAPHIYLAPDGQVALDDLTRLRDREYYVTVDSVLVQAGNPEIRRIENTLHRRSDQKVLAKSVLYIRPADGIPNLLWHRTHRCPEAGGIAPLVRAAFATNK